MEPIVIIMGATGAGKSYQAQTLADKHGWAHISSGELLRQDTSLARFLEAGELVPSPEVNRVVGAAVAAVDANTKIVLDGYPRLVDEAEWFEAHGANGRMIQRVIWLEVSQSTVIERLAERHRSDDTQAATAEKLSEFHAQTQPVIERYEAVGLLVKLDGSLSREEVTKTIEAAL